MKLLFSIATPLLICTHILQVSCYNQGNSTKGSGSKNFLGKIIENCFKDYDKKIRPGFLEYKLTVYLAIHIEAITHVDETDMEFKLIIYLRQYWQDERLVFEPKNSNVSEVPLPSDFGSVIWLPDTFFPHEKESNLHLISVKNQAFAWFPNGTIFSSSRLSITTACPMELTNFPMDYQVCTLFAESFSYTKDEIQYEWSTLVPPLSFSPDALALLNHFKLKGHRWSVTTEYLYGSFQLMKWEFLFGRSIGYYLVALYIPAALLVATSGLAYFMHIDLTPERLGLGVTTVLAMTTLLLAVHSTSPKISYIKAMDIYVGFCFFMVFGSLMQSVLISNLVCMAKNEQRASRRSSEELKGPRLPVGPLVGPEKPKWKGISSWRKICGGWRLQCWRKMGPGEWAHKLDYIGKVGFPAAFVLFNLIYWLYYLNEDKTYKDTSWVNWL